MRFINTALFNQAPYFSINGKSRWLFISHISPILIEVKCQVPVKGI